MDELIDEISEYVIWHDANGINSEAMVKKIILKYVKQKIKPEKEAIKIISDTLSRVFNMGLKQSPHDAENSEFYAPFIDLDIAPNLYKKLSNDSLK